MNHKQTLKHLNRGTNPILSNQVMLVEGQTFITLNLYEQTNTI